MEPMSESNDQQPETEAQELKLVVRCSQRNQEEIEEFVLLPEQRILIGSGSLCHLNSSNGKLPILHSILTNQSGELVIQAVVPAPELKVNGLVCERCVLQHHDRLEIGDQVDFQINLPDQADEFDRKKTEQKSDNQRIDREQKDETMTEKPLKDLTAAELVELIEQEQKVVDEYEQQRQEGAASLLKVIHSIAEQQKTQSDSTELLDAPITIPLPTMRTESHQSGSSDVEQELHYLVEELSELVGELCHQVDQFSQAEQTDEPGNTIAFRNLVNEQHAILEQLDTISELLQGSSRISRKSA